MQEDIVYFDGMCNLCNVSVQFIIARDKRARFKFASLQGDYALHALGGCYIEKHASNGLVLQRGAALYNKSSAALQIARQLNGIWPLLSIFWIVPKPLRDALYNIVAKNRYRWFGKEDTCRIPSAETNHRFL